MYWHFSGAVAAKTWPTGASARRERFLWIGNLPIGSSVDVGQVTRDPEMSPGDARVRPRWSGVESIAHAVPFSCGKGVPFAA